MRNITLCVCILVAMLQFTKIVHAQTNVGSSQTRLLTDGSRGIINHVLLEKIRSLYPDIGLKRDGEHPFFSEVRELARVQTGHDNERLVVEVGWTVPAAMVDHGGGNVLIYWNATDAVPMIKSSEMSLGRGEFRMIKNHWLQFGQSPLVSLWDKKSLEYLKEHGMMNLFCGLSQSAASKALATYMHKGREAFLKLSSIKERNDFLVGLPERVSKIEEYPSLNEDFREADFKYAPPWEGILFFRVTSTNPLEKPVILQICAEGEVEGITSDQVKLVLWNVSATEPTNRPPPEEMNWRKL